MRSTEFIFENACCTALVFIYLVEYSLSTLINTDQDALSWRILSELQAGNWLWKPCSITLPAQLVDFDLARLPDLRTDYQCVTDFDWERLPAFTVSLSDSFWLDMSVSLHNSVTVW